MLNSSYIPSQYNPCRKVTVSLRPLLVFCCLLCRWMVSTYGQYHGGTHVTPWHTLQIESYIGSVVAYLTQRNYAWALKPPKPSQDVSKGQIQTKPAPVYSHRGIWCRWVQVASKQTVLNVQKTRLRCLQYRRTTQSTVERSEIQFYLLKLNQE